MTPMTSIVLAVLAFIAIVIAVDSVRQRRIRAARTIDLRGLVTARLADRVPRSSRPPSSERSPSILLCRPTSMSVSRIPWRSPINAPGCGMGAR